ncbi:hypothetical protein Pelo_6508 [Pelomyxa schiedti]|nr:hypothetical protein Pelo_6508 [Pelomyxa schiedti]
MFTGQVGSRDVVGGGTSSGSNGHANGGGYGTVVEVRTIDQFGSPTQALCSQYNAPPAACGYVACAVARILCNTLRNTTAATSVSVNQVNEWLRTVQDTASVNSEIAKIMQHIHDQRYCYMIDHSDEFPRHAERDSYLRDWVANYEISDWMGITNPQFGNCIQFARQVEPHPEKLKHEELQRVVEEVPFRGLPFFMETYSPNRKLQTPQEWLASYNNHHFDPMQVVYIVDLLGHFAVAKAAVITDNSGTSRNVLFLLNSLGSYVDRPIMKSLYNMIFLHSV